MSWLHDLKSKDEIIYGKDIRFESYKKHSELPDKGEIGVIYKCIDADAKYVWDDYKGTMRYLILAEKF